MLQVQADYLEDLKLEEIVFVGLSTASHFSSVASDFVLSSNASFQTFEDSGFVSTANVFFSTSEATYLALPRL